jgi:hypothetical protein
LKKLLAIRQLPTATTRQRNRDSGTETKHIPIELLQWLTDTIIEVLNLKSLYSLSRLEKLKIKVLYSRLMYLHSAAQAERFESHSQKARQVLRFSCTQQLALVTMRCHYGYLVLAFLGILTVVRSGTVPAEVRVRQKPSTRGSKERFVHKRDYTRGGSIIEESVPPTIIAQAELQSAVQSKPTMMLPVTSAEFPKFLSLSAMMFLIVYIFTISRDTKDALIVTNCGAEAIAFLKVYGVIPAASAFLLLYSYLANKFPPQTLFYITVAPFIAFYFAFAFFLYPLRNALHPMSIPLPQGGMSYAVNLLRHWTFSLYYIMSELWGSAGIPLLFWSCANDVIRIDQVR